MHLGGQWYERMDGWNGIVVFPFFFFSAISHACLEPRIEWQGLAKQHLCLRVVWMEWGAFACAKRLAKKAQDGSMGLISWREMLAH